MLIEEAKLSAKYELLFLIGKGSFGSVFKGVRLADGLVVAIKKVERSNIKDPLILLKSVTRERTINQMLKKLNCPYFIQLLDYFQDEPSVYFIYEFCEGQTLHALMAGRTHQQRQNFLVLALHQILLVLQLLKNNHLLHRDIKPENVLISRGIAKIGDFGLARELTDDGFKTRGVGSAFTTAPEVYSESYSYECDIWSLGVTVHRCLFSCYPFDQQTLQSLDESEVKRRISQRKFKIVVGEQSKLSPLLKKMLVLDPEQRTTVQAMLSEYPLKLELRQAFIAYYSVFRSNNACLRNCLLLMSRLHFSGLAGITCNRTYVAAMTAFVAFSESVMIYKECKFAHTLKLSDATSRLLLNFLLLSVANQTNPQSELQPLLEYMLSKHTAIQQEFVSQLAITNPHREAVIAKVLHQLRRAPILPRLKESLELSDESTTLLELLNRNQRFGECMKNINCGKAIFTYKLYYEETAQFHRNIELI